MKQVNYAFPTYGKAFGANSVHFVWFNHIDIGVQFGSNLVHEITNLVSQNICPRKKLRTEAGILQNVIHVRCLALRNSRMTRMAQQLILYNTKQNAQFKVKCLRKARNNQAQEKSGNA